MSKHLWTGGFDPRRAINPGCEIETVLAALFGGWIRESAANAELLWASLTNTVWVAPSGDENLISFRCAGDIIAAIRDEGDYMNWYCCARAGDVDQFIAAEMAKLGWSFHQDYGLDPVFGAVKDWTLEPPVRGA